jgi:hypothetical protein
VKCNEASSLSDWRTKAPQESQSSKSGPSDVQKMAVIGADMAIRGTATMLGAVLSIAIGLVAVIAGLIAIASFANGFLEPDDLAAIRSHANGLSALLIAIGASWGAWLVLAKLNSDKPG